LSSKKFRIYRTYGFCDVQPETTFPYKIKY
jgi:hypothetical protein